MDRRRNTVFPGSRKAATVGTRYSVNPLQPMSRDLVLAHGTVTSECGFTLSHDCNTALGKSHLPYVV
jgi:hypothetical protein